MCSPLQARLNRVAVSDVMKEPHSLALWGNKLCSSQLVVMGIQFLRTSSFLGAMKGLGSSCRERSICMYVSKCLYC